MAAEIWYNNEKVTNINWASVPKVGDIIELNINDTTNPYEVDKVMNFYPLGSEVPVVRIVVKYAGPGWIGML